MYKNVSPLSGFEDIVGEETKLRDYIHHKISSVYEGNGYQKIDLPLLEYQSLFSPEFVGINPWPGWHPRSLFSLVVKDYKLAYEELLSEENNLFLIPEGTASVCRYVAKNTISKKTENVGIYKLYYITKCFRNELISELKDTKKREFTQIGVELIGENSIYIDLENFALVFWGLESLGIAQKDILIRYSDVRLFNFLVERDNLPLYEQNRLKVILDQIASKRAQGKRTGCLIRKFNATLKELKVCSESSLLWHKLLLKIENVEDLEKELKGFPKEIIENLYNLKKLSSKSIRSNFCADLSIIRGQDYYNQTTFQVDVNTSKGVIVEVGGGGRYDYFISKLLSIEEKVPATGMAYSSERLSTVLKSYFSDKKMEEILHKKGILLWSENPANAAKLIPKYRKKYDIVELSYQKSKSKAEKYANLKNFRFKNIK